MAENPKLPLHPGQVGLDEREGLPVLGYKPTQSDAKIGLVNQVKIVEERFLRVLDGLAAGRLSDQVDARSLATAKTYLQTAAMWAARAVFQPQRISLPEDKMLD